MADLKVSQRARDAAHDLRRKQGERIMRAVRDKAAASVLGDDEGDDALDIQAFARFEQATSPITGEAAIREDERAAIIVYLRSERGQLAKTYASAIHMEAHEGYRGLACPLAALPLTPREGWQEVGTLTKADGYVLGWTKRDDECHEREYFMGRLYGLRPNALINEWSGKWRSITHWTPLPAGPAALSRTGEVSRG